MLSDDHFNLNQCQDESSDHEINEDSDLTETIIIPNGIESEIYKIKHEIMTNKVIVSNNAKIEKPIAIQDISQSPISSVKKLTINDFEIISELGRGAFAKVVHAKYLVNNKLVAIKIVDKLFINKLKKSHEALIEREILSQTDHPSIVKLLSSFHDREKLYFVIEYAPNKDLSHFLRSQGILEYNVAQFYAAEIVSAIEYLHSKNIAHRDLKPENMILDINMHIKIVKHIFF